MFEFVPCSSEVISLEAELLLHCHHLLNKQLDCEVLSPISLLTVSIIYIRRAVLIWIVICWLRTHSLLSRPHPAYVRRRGLVSPVQILGHAKYWSLVIVSVGIQIGQCQKTCSYFCIIPTNATLQFHWSLHASGASPSIWICDMGPLLLMWAGWGLVTRLENPWVGVITVLNFTGWLQILCELWYWSDSLLYLITIPHYCLLLVYVSPNKFCYLLIFPYQTHKIIQTIPHTWHMQ